MKFNQIKTSKENKKRIKDLTQRLQLGTENIIARIAFGYSLANGKQLNLSDIKDSQGKEYSVKVLFGDYSSEYLYLICTHYSLYKTDSDIPKYIKLHIDDGIEDLYNEIDQNPNIDGFDFIIDKVEDGLLLMN